MGGSRDQLIVYLTTDQAEPQLGIDNRALAGGTIEPKMELYIYNTFYIKYNRYKIL